jgi:hypothetical protein
MSKSEALAPAPAPAPAPAAQPLSSLMPPLGASDDGDSVYGGSAAGSDTTLLMSSIMRYRKENGRTYNSCGSAEYWGPNDSDAQGQGSNPPSLDILPHHLPAELYAGISPYATNRSRETFGEDGDDFVPER